MIPKFSRRGVLFALLACLAAVGAALVAPGAGAASPRASGAGPPLGIVRPRGYSGAKAAPRKSALMVWHNGGIMTSAVTKNIFWGPKWANSSFAGDKITGLDTWYSGFSGSNYAATSDEYTGTNGQVGPTTTNVGHVIDTSPASGGGNTTAILNEVGRQIMNPVSNGYYAVYVDLPRVHASYCAYHSFGFVGTTPVQFGFFWNLDGDTHCDPLDNSGLHSQGLAALANVSGHELSEARTDPRQGGWFDSAGLENGDKCAFTFNVPLVTFSNQSQWKVQGEWSNKAFIAHTGYPNNLGQPGCLDGH